MASLQNKKPEGSAMGEKDSPSGSASALELQAVDETKLLRKLDVHLLPALTLLYLLSFLDRSNGEPQS